MKIRIISDIHLDYFPNRVNKHNHDHIIPICEDDRDSVLVLSGDLFSPMTYAEGVDFLRGVSDRFKRIYVVPGNHDFYHMCVFEGDQKWRGIMKELEPYVKYLNNNYEVFEDVIFIGTTLWTNFNNGNKDIMHHAMYGISDYRYIYKGKELIKPYDILDIHMKSVKFLDQRAFTEPTHLKKVVITHHAPSFKSVHPKYKKSELNHCFASDLDWLVEKMNPQLWIHGHTHTSFDYNIGKTRVICNPYGYKRVDGDLENPEFDPNFVVEI
jgi:Icc-related predicted phosphoesterase